MSETVLNNFNEYLINRKEFSTNTINSYDRDLKKIFLYLAKNCCKCIYIKFYRCYNQYRNKIRVILILRG